MQAVITIALSFQTKRQKFKPNACYGRPGIPWPINFLEEQENRLSYLMAFGLLSWSIFDVLMGNTLVTVKLPLRSLRILARLMSCLLAAVVCYPIFATLSAKNLPGLLLGCSYVWSYSVVYAYYNFPCLNTTFSIYAYDIMSLVPFWICMLYLCLNYLYRTFRYFRKRNSTSQDEENKIVTRISLDYVKRLFRQEKSKRVIPQNNGFLSRFLLHIYTPLSNYRYSLTMLVATLIPVEFAFVVTFNLFKAASFGIDFSETALKMCNQSQEFTNNISVWTTTTEISFYFSITLAFISTTISMLLTLKHHRRNLLSSYKGLPLDSESPQLLRMNPTKLVTNSCRYIGYQFGFAIWGFIIQALVFLLITLTINVLLVLIFYYKRYYIARSIVEEIGPFVVYVYVMLILQRIFVYCFFLQTDQRRGKRVPAINNRQWFFNFQYFTAFTNGTVSVFTSVVRIARSFIFGVISLPRLDISIMSRHFEKYDKGHLTYIGVLQLESIHTNPTMHTFVKILLQTTENNQQIINGCQLSTALSKRTYKLNVRNRWHLIITLMNNPGLRLYRKRALNKKTPLYGRRYSEIHRTYDNGVTDVPRMPLIDEL